MSIPSNLRAITAMILAMGMFIASDSCMKLALKDLPMFQLVLLRGYAAVTLCLVLIVATDQAKSLPRMFNPWLIARGVCELAANFSFTFAIIYVALADVTAIAQTCPLLVLLGARLIFGEQLGSVRLFLIGVGILGAVLVAQPGMSAASPYAALGLVTAIAAATRDLITRKVPHDIPALVVSFTVLVLLMVAGGIGMLAFETPLAPSGYHLSLVLTAAVLLIGGHTFLFIAYKIGPARSVAPFMYTLTIWAVFWGVVLFGDIPNALAIAGMALIVAAGLAVIYLDGRQRARGRAPAAEPAPAIP